MSVLIVVFMTSLSATGVGLPGVSMQEFSSRQRCEEAGAAVVDLAKKVPVDGRSIQWRCVWKEQ